MGNIGKFSSLYLKRSLFLVLISLVSCSLIILATQAVTAQSNRTFWPILKSDGPPDPAEVEQLRTLVETYYDMTGHAARDGDVTKFPSILVDEPTIPLENWQVEAMHKFQAQGNGMLSYEMAFFGSWKAGSDKLLELQRKAEKEGRLITPEELRSVSGSNVIAAPLRTDPLPAVNIHIIFSDVIIDGNQAKVTYDAYEQSFTLFCVKKADGWKIAGMHVLTGIVDQS